MPELLAPAGSFEALRAAVAAGADAVYFGGGGFNARARAQNFTDAEIREAVVLCHAHGVKTYMTFNTLVTDRELPQMLAAARVAYRAGVDALIVADLGAAELLHRALPDLPLHASTQCSVHSTTGAKALAARGFCRVVPARELPREEIARLVRDCGIEVEVFIHGALCVSHSGQCLFSSLVGGRSGNRGACAQPCRLPDKNGRYPLSLKDLCLAEHIPQLIEAGVHSLKIEGRLKSPSYVYRVVSVYRRLLDERRAATRAELAELDAAFSRSGFTDGYFESEIDRKMLGVRSESDKEKAVELSADKLTPTPVPISLSCIIEKDKPIALTLQNGAKTVTVTGDIPLLAQNAPLTKDTVEDKLSRFGGTPFYAKSVEIKMDEGLMLPISRLNDLRRRALALLTNDTREVDDENFVPHRAKGARVGERSARFLTAAQITDAAKEHFAVRYLPLEAYDRSANGVVLPPVMFDGEEEEVLKLLQDAMGRGAKYALVGNVGHLALAKRAGLVPHGDLRLNVCNEGTLATLLEQGFERVLLSPELTLPQIRDMDGACDAVIYGRVPLMLLEKCVGKEVGSCALCHEGKNQLVDRRGEKFPVFCQKTHHGVVSRGDRNVLYNSRPTAMSDKASDLARAGITAGHFIFSTESPAEVDAVIRAYRDGASLGNKVRRI